MDISRKWLKDFVDVDVNDKEYADVMTLVGQKVETVTRMDAEIKNVVVGKVLSMVRHENSDHMWVCQVDVGGSEPEQIVTGAQNVKKAIDRLVRAGIVPIINENDVVADEELKGRTFGDNDWLSFLIAKLVKADTLILLTTVDGLLDAAGRRIPRVESFRNVARLVRAGEKGRLSKGGMDSKLKAVKAAVEAGIDVYVANGRKTVLAPILAGRNVATFFPGSAL